jgi:hypothetical protein
MEQKPKTVFRKVKVLFTEEEKIKMGESIAHELSILDEIKGRKQQLVAELSQEVKDKEADISKLKDGINLGYEFKEKEVELIKNFESGFKEYWLDGEIIETEELTAMDHQLSIMEAEEANRLEDERIAKETESFEAKLIEDKGPLKDSKPKINKKDKERFRELVASAELAFEEKRYQDAYNLYEDAILVNPFDNTVSEKMESLKPFI